MPQHDERVAARVAEMRARVAIARAKIDDGKRYSAPRVNRVGYVPREPDETDTAFAAFAATCKRPVLVIGAGSGHAAPAALAAGATVIVNELSFGQLGEWFPRVTDRKRMSVKIARFPGELDITPESLDAIHAARVLRYLPPADVEAGFASAFSWLAPGGKLFLHDSTQYTRANADFVAVFERRKAAGENWPGFVADPAAVDDPTLPPALHVFDADTLAAAATRAGFVVESARCFTPAALPDFMRLDGRECAELIARKPA